MSSKPTGLAAFNRKGVTPDERPSPRVEAQGARKRAQGEIVALTVRLPRSEWARLHQLAVSEGVSLQTLAIRGFDKVFADQGLPPILLDVKAS
jgi:hypothetical protein